MLKLAEGAALDKALYGGGAAAAAAAAPRPPPVLEETCALFAGIARGLAYMHSRGVAHNDLKAANVLLDERGNPMLADFGLIKSIRAALPGTFAAMMAARGVGPQGVGLLGSLEWTAPENFFEENNPDYGQPPADVYSLGMVGFELVARAPPWRGLNSGQVLEAVRAGRRPQLPAGLDARLKGIIEDCWKQAPAARPSAVDVQMRLQAIAGSAGARPAAAAAARRGGGGGGGRGRP